MTHPLRGLEPTDLPPELQARVLAAAALTRPADWWDRVYEDRRFWTAAAALAIVLLLALCVPFSPWGNPSPAATPPGDAVAQAGDARDEPSGAPGPEQWPLVSRELLMPWRSP